MSGKKIIVYILIIFFIMSGHFIYAQNERLIKWQPVYGAGGYIIEIKNSDGRIIIEKEIISASFDISKLDSGKYSYRITTLNKLKQRGRSTSWTGFTVEKAVIPEIKSISRKFLAWSYDNPRILVRGNNFDKNTKIFLRKGTQKIETDSRFNSDTELSFEYDPESDDAGTYDVVAVNEAGFEAVLKGAIEIIAPDIPVIDSVSADRIYHSSRSELVIRGTSLGQGTVPILEDENGKRLQVRFRSISDTEIILTIDPLPADKGNYYIYARRNEFFVSEKKFMLLVTDPEKTDNIAVVKDPGAERHKTDNNESGKTEGDIYLGIAWEYNMPLGLWSDELTASPVGFYIYFAYQLKGFGFLSSVPVLKSLEFETKTGYSVFDLSAGTGEEYYRIINIAAGLNWSLPLSLFNGRLFPVLSIDTGLAYSTVSIKNYSGSNSYSSFDPLVNTGLTLRYKQGMFFSDLSCGWQRIFYVANPMDEVKISLCAGVIL